MHRRLRPSLAVMLVVLVAVISYVGMSGRSQPPETVSWSDESASRSALSARLKPDPRPAAPPCLAKDLESLWPENGHTFSDPAGLDRAGGVRIMVRNVGAATCTLSGHPRVQGTDRFGDPVGAPAGLGTYFTAVGSGATSAVIEPGEPAQFLLSTGSNGCDGPMQRIHGADVLLDNGFTFAIKGAWLRGTCPLRVTQWQEISPHQRRFRALEARLLAPSTVQVGADLYYSLELINVTASVVPLAPCLAFTQVLSAEDDFDANNINDMYHSTHRLNCGDRVIGPHGAVRYQMKIPVPLDFPLGQALIYWSVEGEERPTAMSAVNVLNV